MKKTATATLFLDTRSSDKGWGVVKLSINYARKQRPKTTGLKMSVADWRTLQRSIDEHGLSSKVRSENLMAIYNFLYVSEDSELLKAKKIIERLEDNFNFEKFFYYYDFGIEIENKSEQTTDLIKAVRERQKLLEQSEQVSLAGILQCVAVSFERFILSLSKSERINLGLSTDTQNTDLSFKQLSVSFLNKYEVWALKHGRVSRKKGSPTTSPVSPTTISIYLRNVRTIYKVAIRQKIVSEEDYPFSAGRYVIPNSEGTKKALSKADIEKIIGYVPERHSQEEQALSLWVFSYLSNGMNINDICRLKWSDIDEARKTISFVRTKTKTKSKQKVIVANLFPITENIIATVGCQREVSEYVFPFFEGTGTEAERKHKIKLVTKLTNKYMNQISEKLGIDINLTTYVARHSFATILSRNNVPTLFISQSLGHSSIKTTENYLGSFEKEQTEDFLKLLL